jgi:hypothetical protein
MFGSKVVPQKSADLDRFVFIGGPGHSGSTLLDLLLNNSPLVQSVGEVHRLNHDARNETEPCTCGRPITSCPFWLEVEACLRNRLNSDPAESLLRNHDMMLITSEVGLIGTILQKALLLLGSPTLYNFFGPLCIPAHESAMARAFDWYAAIRETSRCPVLLESTKDLRRLKLLYLKMPRAYRLLYMIRDGRAVAASDMRRTKMPMEQAVRRWMNYHRQADYVLSSVPTASILRVRYEELCRTPATILQGICDFIGIPFKSEMVQLRKQEAHNIGGNPMRFRQNEDTIRLDERWRCDLSPKDIDTFERVAGRMNRRLGYHA